MGMPNTTGTNNSGNQPQWACHSVCVLQMPVRSFLENGPQRWRLDLPDIHQNASRQPPPTGCPVSATASYRLPAYFSHGNDAERMRSATRPVMGNDGPPRCCAGKARSHRHGLLRYHPGCLLHSGPPGQAPDHHRWRRHSRPGLPRQPAGRGDRYLWLRPCLVAWNGSHPHLGCGQSPPDCCGPKRVSARFDTRRIFPGWRPRWRSPLHPRLRLAPSPRLALRPPARRNSNLVTQPPNDQSPSNQPPPVLTICGTSP